MNKSNEDKITFVVVQSPINQINEDTLKQMYHNYDKIKEPESRYNKTISEIKRNIEQNRQKSLNQAQKQRNYHQNNIKTIQKQSIYYHTPFNSNSYKIKSQRQKQSHFKQNSLSINPKICKLLKEIEQFKSAINNLKESSLSNKKLIQNRFYSERKKQITSMNKLPFQKDMNEIRNRYITYHDYKTGKDKQKLSHFNFTSYNNNYRTTQSQQINIQRFQIQFDQPNTQNQ